MSTTNELVFNKLFKPRVYEVDLIASFKTHEINIILNYISVELFKQENRKARISVTSAKNPVYKLFIDSFKNYFDFKQCLTVIVSNVKILYRLNIKYKISFNDSNAVIFTKYDVTDSLTDGDLIKQEIETFKNKFINELIKELPGITFDIIDNYIISYSYNIKHSKLLFNIDREMYQYLMNLYCKKHDILNKQESFNIVTDSLYSSIIDDKIYIFQEHLHTCKNCKKCHKYFFTSIEEVECKFICSTCGHQDPGQIHLKHVCNPTSLNNNNICHLCLFYHNKKDSHIPNRKNCFHHQQTLKEFIITNREHCIKIFLKENKKEEEKTEPFILNTEEYPVLQKPKLTPQQNKESFDEKKRIKKLKKLEKKNDVNSKSISSNCSHESECAYLELSNDIDFIEDKSCNSEAKEETEAEIKSESSNVQLKSSSDNISVSIQIEDDDVHNDGVMKRVKQFIDSVNQTVNKSHANTDTDKINNELNNNLIGNQESVQDNNQSINQQKNSDEEDYLTYYTEQLMFKNREKTPERINETKQLPENIGLDKFISESFTQVGSAVTNVILPSSEKENIKNTTSDSLPLYNTPSKKSSKKEFTPEMNKQNNNKSSPNAIHFQHLTSIQQPSTTQANQQVKKNSFLQTSSPIAFSQMVSIPRGVSSQTQPSTSYINTEVRKNKKKHIKKLSQEQTQFVYPNTNDQNKKFKQPDYNVLIPTTPTYFQKIPVPGSMNTPPPPVCQTINTNLINAPFPFNNTVQHCSSQSIQTQLIQLNECNNKYTFTIQIRDRLLTFVYDDNHKQVYPLIENIKS